MSYKNTKRDIIIKNSNKDWVKTSNSFFRGICYIFYNNRKLRSFFNLVNSLYPLVNN